MTSRYLPVRTRRALAEQTTCATCGGPGPFERDHHCPHALDGSNEPENMRNLCIPCHKKKTKRDCDMIDKADRLKAKRDGTWIGGKSRPMQSRGFEKGRRRKWPSRSLGSDKRQSFQAPVSDVSKHRWPKRKMQSRGWA